MSKNITREELLKDDLYELSNYDEVRTLRILNHIKLLTNENKELRCKNKALSKMVDSEKMLNELKKMDL